MRLTSVRRWSTLLAAVVVATSAAVVPAAVPVRADECDGPMCGRPFPVDHVAPVVTISRPGKARRTSAASWRTLRGTITDGGIGPRRATARAVVRTPAGWAYLKGSRWRTAAKKAVAVRRTRTFTDRSVLTGLWQVTLPVQPPLGVLHVHAWGADYAENVSSPVRRKQRLTR